MKNEQMIASMNYIDDDIVQETHLARIKKKSSPLFFIPPLAFASFILALAIFHPRQETPIVLEPSTQKDETIASPEPAVDESQDLFALATETKPGDLLRLDYSFQASQGEDPSSSQYELPQGNPWNDETAAPILPVFKDLYLESPLDEAGRKSILEEIAGKLDWGSPVIKAMAFYSEATFSNGCSLALTDHARLTLALGESKWIYGNEYTPEIASQILADYHVIFSFSNPAIYNLVGQIDLYDNAGTIAQALYNYSCRQVSILPEFHSLTWQSCALALSIEGQYAIVPYEESLAALQASTPWELGELVDHDLVYAYYGDLAVPSYRFVFQGASREYIYPAIDPALFEFVPAN